MANPREMRVPAALGHTLGYGMMPARLPSHTVGGAAVLQVGGKALCSAKPSVEEMMRSIADARWALTLSEHICPVREQSLFIRKKASASAGDLAALARMPYAQRSAKLYPQSVAARSMPRTCSMAEIVGRKYDGRNTITGKGFTGKDGYDLIDGRGKGRNGTTFNHALWREGQGRKQAVKTKPPYSWRNYQTDGPSEISSAMGAPSAEQLAPSRICGTAQTTPKDTSNVSASTAPASRENRSMAKTAKEAGEAASSERSASKADAVLQEDEGQHLNRRPVTAAGVGRTLGASASSPCFLGWSQKIRRGDDVSGSKSTVKPCPAVGASTERCDIDAGREKSVAPDRSGRAIGARSEIAGGSTIGDAASALVTASELMSYEELGESASQLGSGQPGRPSIVRSTGEATQSAAQAEENRVLSRVRPATSFAVATTKHGIASKVESVAGSSSATSIISGTQTVRNQPTQHLKGCPSKSQADSETYGECCRLHRVQNPISGLHTSTKVSAIDLGDAHSSIHADPLAARTLKVRNTMVSTDIVPTAEELSSLEYKAFVEREKEKTAERLLAGKVAVIPPWVHNGEVHRPPSAGRPWPAILSGPRVAGELGRRPAAYASAKGVAESRSHKWAGCTLQAFEDLNHMRPSALQPEETIEKQLHKHDYYAHSVPLAHPPNPNVNISSPPNRRLRAQSAGFVKRQPAWH